MENKSIDANAYGLEVIKDILPLSLQVQLLISVRANLYRLNLRKIDTPNYKLPFNILIITELGPLLLEFSNVFSTYSITTHFDGEPKNYVLDVHNRETLHEIIDAETERQMLTEQYGDVKRIEITI